jgi:hypothetical protein
VFDFCIDGDGFPGKMICFGESWNKHGAVDWSPEWEDVDEDDPDVQGWGRYAPRVIVSPCSDPADTVPSRRNSVPDCQVMTLCENEVNDEPCAAVEKTGCRRRLPRRRFEFVFVDGRKKERCDITTGSRIEDSKLPGSMIDSGSGTGDGCWSTVSSSDCAAAESDLSRFCDRSRFLLKRRCSNNGVRGSNRYGSEVAIIFANDL